MRELSLYLGRKSHTIQIGTGLLSQIPQENSVVITNPTVRTLHSSTLTCPILEIEDSENAKQLSTIETLCKQLIELGADRSTTIIALGGGVVGDVVGMTASVFMRGVPVIQVPTTLLAQVDSSIGGKTGVNLPQGKNLIGTFHQPSLVLSDINTLKTLPEKELRHGLAEVVKTAIIGDAELFELLENNLDKIMNKDEQILEEIVFRCAKVKAGIVERDEKESHERMKLNLGHTFGHTIETLSNYTIPHGDAVSIGLVKAAELANVEAERIKNLLEKIGLPTETTFTDSQIEQAMCSDKKRKNNKLRLVLPEKIGGVKIIEK